MNIEEWKAVQPTEQNGYCVFDRALEEDENVFFHSTSAENIDSIVERGFLPAKALGEGARRSVSFAKRSSACFAHFATRADTGIAIFAVRFEDGDLARVQDGQSDIHVLDPQLQPRILGYVRMEEPFQLP